MKAILSNRCLSTTLPVGFILGLLVLCAFPLHTFSQPSISEERDDIMDSDQIGTFIDGLMHAYLESNQVAGAAVAIVRGGELLYSGGYGWADIELRKPVDPSTSLFRIGSVTKLFTWTAIMQLRDAGKLDLDTDINEYLDFQIPSTFDEPITLRHLLTHTPGFEDRIFRLFGRVEDNMYSEWLQRHLPARINPPGIHSSYSNYGTTLAGYIVEQVSGMKWDDYIDRHILEPLEMEFATTRQPIPDELKQHLVNGYNHEDGGFVHQKFEWLEGHAAAGGMSASAEAMSRFMLAFLQGGTLDGEQILQDSTVQEMFSREFVPDPRMNAVALGFYEMSSHGLRILGHGGSTSWFFTDLAIFPDEDLGIFVSFNSPGAAFLGMGNFRQAVLDRFYPTDKAWPGLRQKTAAGFEAGIEAGTGQQPARVPIPEREVAPGWEDRAKAYEGVYLSLRRSHTTFEKPLGMAIGRVRVETKGHGEIVMHSMLGTHQFREIEPGYFQEANEHAEVVFRGSPEDGYTHLYLGDAPMMTFERQSFWDSSGLHLGLLLFCFLVFLSLPVIMVVRYVLQLYFSEITPLYGSERWLRWTGMAFVLLVLWFLVLLLATLDTPATFMAGEREGLLRIALIFPVLSVPLAIVLVGGAVYAIHQRLWNRWSRAWFTLFALAAVLFLMELQYWNLLGWNI